MQLLKHHQRWAENTTYSVKNNLKKRFTFALYYDLSKFLVFLKAVLKLIYGFVLQEIEDFDCFWKNRSECCALGEKYLRQLK